MPFDGKIALVSTVTRSHLPSARVMFESMHRLYPDMPMYLLLVDRPEGDCSCGDYVEVIPVESLALPHLGGMVHRYDNTELCVALKPTIIQTVFERKELGIKGAIYFDTDIYAVSPMEEVEKLVNDGIDFIIAPHITKPSHTGNTTELTMLKHGAYNAGFLYFANSDQGNILLKWWAEWLTFFCYEDFRNGVYGDQKWMDLFPSFIENYVVLRHEGYNVAWWNIDQRKVLLKDGGWTVNGVPLRFVHFSNVQFKPVPLFSRVEIGYDKRNLFDVSLLFETYVQKIMENGYASHKGLPCLLRPANRPVVNKRLGFSGKMDKAPNFQKMGVISSFFYFIARLPLNVFFAMRALFRIPSLIRPHVFYKDQRKLAMLIIERARKKSGVWRCALFSFILSTALKLHGGVGGVWKQYLEKGFKGVKENVLTAFGTQFPPPKNAILVTDVRIPHHDMIAADLLTFNFLKNLVEFGYQVTFVPAMHPWPWRYCRDIQQLGVTMEYDPLRHGNIKEYIASIAHQFPAFCLMPMWVAVDLIDMLRFTAPKAKIMYLAADLSFTREIREAELSGNPELLRQARKTKERELELIEAVDRLVVVSDKEKEHAEKELSGKTPISVLNTLYVHCVENVNPYENRSGILFVGVFGHRPNIDAVLWFASEIWPLARKEFPDVQLHVVGNYAPPEILALNGKNNIRIEGFVPNLQPLLDSTRVNIAPLRYGAGIKGKIASAMGSGLPCVCTAVATEGMNITDGKNALVADAPEAFAAAVVRLYNERKLWERLSSAGLALARERFGAEAGKRLQEAVLRESGFWPEIDESEEK